MSRCGWPRQTLAVVSLLGALSTGCAGLSVPPSGADGSASPETRPLRPSNAQFLEAYRRLPLHFERNQGQASANIEYLARLPGYRVAFSPTDIALIGRRATVGMSVVGASPAPRLTAGSEFPGRVNYFRGRDPGGWQAGIPTYARLTYEAIYPGIDLVFYGSRDRLEYDFVVAPGADPESIRLMFTGADALTIDPDGNLVIPTAGGPLLHGRPLIYQEDRGVRTIVSGGWRVGHDGTATFEVAAYDRSRPLVIDPVLAYGTYFGGTRDEAAFAITVDTSGNAFVTGTTMSSDMPTTPGVAQPAFAGGDQDAFVMKLNPTGSGLVYATYLGGSANEDASGIAIDASGNAYVTGETSSTNFPTTAGALAMSAPGGTNAWVAKLGPTGGLLAATYLGGSLNDLASSVAIGPDAGVYVAGATFSNDFPTTPSGIQPTKSDARRAGFVVKLAGNLSTLAYGTYIHGSDHDLVMGIAVDGSGNIYGVGRTTSGTFPTTPGALKPSPGCVSMIDDAFVVKIDASGAFFAYSTLLGGSGQEWGLGIAVRDGYAHVTGFTFSTDFPVVNAFQATKAGGPNDSDAFVSKLSTDGRSLIYSTYLGGSSSDTGNAVAVDPAGAVVVAGTTQSGDFPLVDPLVSPVGVLPFDAWVAKLTESGTVVFSTSIGNGLGWGVAADSTRNVYVAGSSSGGILTTAGAHRTSPRGADAFVVKLAPGSSGGGGTDTEPPTAAITEPADGVTVTAPFRVSAIATDDASLLDLRIWGLHRVLVTVPCNGRSCNATVIVDLSAEPDGAYEFNAMATDRAGRRTISSIVTVVKGAPTVIVPSGAFGPEETFSVSFQSPVPGATVWGSSVPIQFRSVGGADPEGDGFVERRFVMTIDRTTVADEAGTFAYGNQAVLYPWPTTAYPDGPHLFELTATDERGRTVPAVAAYGALNHPSGLGAPGGALLTASVLTSPSSGPLSSDIAVAVRADFASAGAGATLKLALDGVEIRNQGVACREGSCMWSWVWNTNTIADGPHTLTGTVEGSTGGTATQSITVTVANGAGGGGPQNVVWTSAVRVAVTGNTITKNAGCSGCADAGAISEQTIAGGSGFVEFKVSAGAMLTAGLSNDNPGTSSTEIKWGLRFYPGGYVEVRESGVYKADWPLVAGATHKVAVNGGAVEYYQDGTLKYTSAVAPTYPMLVDTSLATLGSAVQNAVISTGP